ncbi:pirin family protein [Luteimonas sp. MC1572]|uniref:pirin family protein n=1 Tax=Luteimonas sp. MC1572 TaxID=2799325 RepID=UPI0018F0E2DF|nr:pirin family protein [Luteimonas sp. MC1572]MBJ6982532.1 pirin family protein [Luteimonas sp. MC1572]QQO03784.1 pirin family protein [Luteimonas sp. MC1572]
MSPATPFDSTRVVRKVRGRAASDGAGVRLTRVIGGQELPDLDPFLLLDEFGTDRPEDYLAGFPDHPHRGFETVTYMLDGRMRHRDNHGNEGLLVPGSVQWMTAGRGLVHSEMPEQQEGRMRGFQLWVNLPAKDKMTAPRYQEFAPERIPLVAVAEGVEVRVVAGEVSGDDGVRVRGPIEQPATDPMYLDASLAPGAAWEHRLPEGHNAFAYVFEGDALLGSGDEARQLVAHELGILGGGDLLRVQAGAAGTRLLLVSGRPLREPVARHGPFVMNTREELMQAFVDLQEGRF